MADVQTISPADLSAIENNLRTIHSNIDVLNSHINTVDSNVRVIYDELGQLAKDFQEYVHTAERQHNLAVAETRLVKIRQDLETRFGHYAEIRRTTTGILQADDLGIVKKETISTATEEMMLTTPNYWLAPCLVALSAWISDQRELAGKALREAIKRDDEKTSLLLALICRRAGRKDACLKWTQRYLANQDEENLDRKAIVILDAFASGLLGADSEGAVARQIDEWMEHLSSKSGFVEQQTQQWSDAIRLQREPIANDAYPYLRQYSRTWPQLEDILEGAYLHANMFSYLENIFEQQASTAAVKTQLDEIMTELVTDFDDEELPLRRDEKLNQFIVDFNGDVSRAQASMQVEQTAFETHNDFTQLLTDAAMKPESSHASVSTQKFAIALSRDWIRSAYNDVTAQNRMKIPNTIEINVDTFNDSTADGQNEEALITRFQTLVEQEKASALTQCVLSAFEKFCLYGGIVAAVLGVVILLTSSFWGVLVAIVGIGMVMYYFSAKKRTENYRQHIENEFNEKRESGTKIIRAVLAEVVDFRAEFSSRDQESQKVIDFLNQIAPDMYVRKAADSSRRVYAEKADSSRGIYTEK